MNNQPHNTGNDDNEPVIRRITLPSQRTSSPDSNPPGSPSDRHS
ncbi:hypothetical protein [Kitasatospora sp. NPDC093679]